MLPKKMNPRKHGENQGWCWFKPVVEEKGRCVVSVVWVCVWTEENVNVRIQLTKSVKVALNCFNLNSMTNKLLNFKVHVSMTANDNNR